MHAPVAVQTFLDSLKFDSPLETPLPLPAVIALFQTSLDLIVVEDWDGTRRFIVVEHAGGKGGLR